MKPMLKNILWGAILCGAAPGLLQAATNTELRNKQEDLLRELNQKTALLNQARSEPMNALLTVTNSAIQKVDDAIGDLNNEVEKLATDLDNIDTATGKVNRALIDHAGSMDNTVAVFQKAVTEGGISLANKEGAAAYSDLSIVATDMKLYVSNVLNDWQAAIATSWASLTGVTPTLTTPPPTPGKAQTGLLIQALTDLPATGKAIADSHTAFQNTLTELNKLMI